jgi:hypothetical protein
MVVAAVVGYLMAVPQPVAGVVEAVAAATVHDKGLEVVAVVAVAGCIVATQLSAVAATTVTTTPAEERMVVVKAVGKPVAIVWWR